MSGLNPVVSEWLQTLGSMTTRDEENALYTLAKWAGRFGHIVEIGSCRGHSTICLALGLKEINSPFKVYAVDPHEWEDTLEDFLINLDKAGVMNYVIPRNDESLNVAPGFDAPISLLFIDGLHDYDNVKADFDAWMPKVITEGVVALHDTGTYIGPCEVAMRDVFISRNFYMVSWIGSNFTIGKKGRASFLDDFIKRLAIMPYFLTMWKRRTRILPTLHPVKP